MGAPPVQPGKQTPRPGPLPPGAPQIGRGKTPPTGQMAGMTLSSPTTGTPTQPTTTKTPSTSEASQSKPASTVPSAVPTQSAPSGNPIRDAGSFFIYFFFLSPEVEHSSPRRLAGEKKCASYNHKTTIWVCHEYYLNPEFLKI